LTFNPQQVCCEAPPAVDPICPVSFIHWYDENNVWDACWAPADYGCTYVDITVPTCFPTYEGCYVVSKSPTGGDTLTCVSPCPPNASPGGACNP
jgi:hypothetical protein